jgi:hypothetical protein
LQASENGAGKMRPVGGRSSRARRLALATAGQARRGSASAETLRGAMRQVPVRQSGRRSRAGLPR